MITLWRNELATKYNKKSEEIIKILNESVLEKILESVRDNAIEEGDVKEVMIRLIEGKGIEEAMKFDKMGGDVLEEQIRKIVNENPGLRVGAYMGILISKIGGSFDKRKAMEILSKIVK